MKKIVTLFAAVVFAGSMTMKAADELYAVFNENDETLTFYYDGQMEERKGETYWGWYKHGVETVIFDPSVADARPTSTEQWFLAFRSLRNFQGMEYLNTSEVENMSEMFTTCTNLPSLDLSHFDVTKVTDMTKMFMNCESLTTIYCNQNWSSVASSENMFANCAVLQGEEETMFDGIHADAEYARPDEPAKGQPGYFTRKNETAIDNQMVNGKSSNRKFLRDGQILILRGDKIYSVPGQEIN